MSISARDRLQMLLDQRFRAADNKFEKLTSDDSPYRFVRWTYDEDNVFCLYYEFDSNQSDTDMHKKRVPLHELEQALTAIIYYGQFSREHFAQVCPTAKKAGPCGFAVTGRCLEKLDVAEYVSPEHRFRLTNKTRAKMLLESASPEAEI